MRTRNNKNIQNMEQKDIDIYEILENVLPGTPGTNSESHEGMEKERGRGKIGIITHVCTYMRT